MLSHASRNVLKSRVQCHPVKVLHAHLSSAVASSMTETDSHLNIGEEFYQQAKQHLQNHDQAQTEREETNREKQYQKPGIAVVKTIVKQTRQHQQKQQKQTISEWDKAQECMQIAAFVHGYQDAIVSLANHALSTLKFDARKEYTYISSISKEDQNQNSTIIPMEELNDGSGAEVAMKLYECASRLGSKEGWFNLGHLHWTGHDPDIEPNQELAIECFENAVELGDDDARYFLSVHYLGQDVDSSKDEDEEEEDLFDGRKRGLMLLQEAGDNAHVGALYYLALMYRNGDQGLYIEPCTTLYREYLDEAADGGDADALFLKAHCMYNGEDGYEIDKRRALDGFVEAGEAGNADGFVSAGAIYHNGGFEVKQDQRRAFELYQQAGELGSTEGWKNVVACYALGEGVPRCEKTAMYISKTMLNDEHR